VYLDLGHWINLGKAESGRPDGVRFGPTLERCRTARRSGEALFPLAASLYEEVGKITSPQQRTLLAELMEELSGFTALLKRSRVVALELDAALTQKLGPSPTPPPSLDLLGPGCGWAFDQLEISRVHSPAGDITEEVREQMGVDAFDALIGSVVFLREQLFLAGPSDQDSPRARSLGWDPLASQRVAARRAASEQAFQDQLDDQTRRKRSTLRDLVLARETIIELREMLAEAAGARGRSVDEALGPDVRAARALARSMPSVEVATTLKAQDHRNKDKRWESNDIFDIDALSLAVPYCDIVVTDSHRAHVLRATGLDNRMQTVVLADTTDLLNYL
jgi:hypothetical protein